jgi:glycosyltransferase involved in cell wall biosynthesis
VYNGQRYLARAIENHLNQTFSDFELVISDNCSDDATPEICSDYARRDSRIRYIRQAQNIGVNRNHKFVFDLSSEKAEFFRWAAADDLLSCDLLQTMVSLLEIDSKIVAVVPDTVNIDAHGEIVRFLERTLDLRTDDVIERVRAVLTRGYQMVFAQGLMRKSTLGTTARRWEHFGWDFILLLELALRGQIAQPEMSKLYRRQHDGEASRARTMTAVKRWVDPSLKSRFLLPHWRWAFERVRAVLLAPLPMKLKAKALRLVAAHTLRARHSLARDLLESTRMLLGKTDEIPF